MKRKVLIEGPYKDNIYEMERVPTIDNSIWYGFKTKSGKLIAGPAEWSEEVK